MTLKQLFGNQVKLLRKHSNMTQEVLSELIDVDIRQLARIEAGESFVTADTLEKLSKALNVRYSDFFEFSEFENFNQDMTHNSIIKFNQNYKDLNKLIYTISEDEGKTEYLKLAIDALSKRSARDKLRSLLLGLDLK